MSFFSREDAGRKLGRYLKERGIDPDWVLGLPRGGVVVAAAVAEELGRPLGVLVVRKIGHPLQREFAVGALAEQGVILLDRRATGMNPLLRGLLDEVIAEEKERLLQYQSRFHPQGPPDLGGKAALLVDDGLATGATMEAAVMSAQKQSAAAVLVATPVASMHAIERLAAVADQVWALEADPAFEAVGKYYELFPQTTDDEVLKLLLERGDRGSE
jgi:putative phosphoribosyl transferase